MSYLFGTRGIAFWKSGVKKNVLSLLGSFPGGAALQKGWFGLPQSFLSSVKLRSQGNGAAWGALEPGGRQWAGNTKSCTSILLHWVLAKQELGKGSGAAGTRGRTVTGVKTWKGSKGTAAQWVRVGRHCETTQGWNRDLLGGFLQCWSQFAVSWWTAVTAILCGRHGIGLQGFGRWFWW